MDLTLIVLKTQDVHGLAEFYSSLGLSFEKHNHGNGPTHYTVEIGRIVFEIYPLPDKALKADDTTRLGFKVENLNERVQILENKGIEIVSKPKMKEWGYTAVVKDFDGRRIELTEIEK